jgi:hypothetical protein
VNAFLFLITACRIFLYSMAFSDGLMGIAKKNVFKESVI